MENVQAGGDIRIAVRNEHHHYPPKIGLQALHPIPPPRADFTGREKELEELLKRMESGGVTISGLTGMGGIGKTALAFVLAHRLRANYPDAQLFLDMRGTSGPARTPAEALTTIIRAFHPVEQLPEDADALQGLYHTVLDGKRVLILLDDARDRAQVEGLIPPPTCALVITSRLHFTLPGLHPLRLDRLTPDDAEKLLRKIAPRINEAEAARLALLNDYLPLALTVVSSILAEHPDISPTDYLRWLEDEQQRLEPVEASFTFSYDLLNETLQQRWRMLAAFPGTFDRLATAAVWGVDIANEAEVDKAAKVLSTLVRYSLVEWLEAEQRYRLHDLARLFANARLADDERDAVQRRHAAHFHEVLAAANDLYLRGGEGVLQGLALFDAEWPNIQAGQAWAASHAEQDDKAAHLCSRFPDEGIYVLTVRLHPRELIKWLQSALIAARQSNDRSLEASTLGNLGNAHFKLDQMHQALAYYQQQLTLTREIGDRRGEGYALGCLGNTYFQWGEVQQAIDYYQQHLAKAREIDDRRSEATVLGNLGNAHRDLGEVQQAITYCQQELTLSREIGDWHGEANALGNLGNTYLQMGDVRQALPYYQQQLAITREIGDQRGEANALWNMSLALDGLGERERAILLAEAALHIYQQIEDPYAETVQHKLAAWRGEEPPP